MLGREREVRMWVMSGREIRLSASWSRRWNVSRRELRRGGGRVVVEWMAVMVAALEVRVGDVGIGRVVCGGGRPRGVQGAGWSFGVDDFGVVVVAVVVVVVSRVLEGEV